MSTSKPEFIKNSIKEFDIEHKKGGRSSTELLEYLQKLIQDFYAQNPEASDVSFEIEGAFLYVYYRYPMTEEEIESHERYTKIRELAEEKGLTFNEAASYMQLKEKGVI